MKWKTKSSNTAFVVVAVTCNTYNCHLRGHVKFCVIILSCTLTFRVKHVIDKYGILQNKILSKF